MSVQELGPAQVVRVIRSVRERDPRARRIGIRHEGVWKGGDTVRDGADEFRVAVCPSPLAVRAALLDAGDQPIVVITPAAPNDLGLDVLARLANRRLQSVERFEALKHVFGAIKADARLSKLRWLADELLAAAPLEGYPVPENGFLDLDRVWQAFFERRLGIDSPKPDLRALLKACLEDKTILDWRTWPPEVREGAASRIGEGAGRVGRLVLTALEAERPLHPVAIGLVCRVLFDTASGNDELELKQAIARLEPALSGQSPTKEMAEEWAREAETVVLAPAATPAIQNAQNKVVQAAQQLLADLKVPHHAWRSRLIPSGFEERVARFARQVKDALDGAINLDTLFSAERHVAEHVSCRGHGERRRRAAEMATRLVRWLASAGGMRAPFGSFHAAVAAYADELSFVDQAREELAVGEPSTEAAKAYARLAEASAKKREELSHAFAERLAAWSENPADGGGLLRIECVLSEVVAPLAKQRHVLLLVVDGMSYSVFRQLLEGVAALGWVEMVRNAEQKRLCAISALPSITEVSRASLLCGVVRRGLAADEKKGFEAHDALRTASKGGRNPILFHKAELSDGGGFGLPDDLANALGATGPRVVGLVVNAVDDHLAKGDQSAPRWGIEAITQLHAVFETTFSAGRLLVVTADHGHVLERGTELRSHGDEGERHRRPAGVVEAGEVLVKGPRVVCDGNAVILPWSERLRYSKKKNGYHGGASPQEVVVPLAVFAPGDLALEGWSELTPDAPDWWDLDLVQKPATPKKAVTKTSQSDLFARAPANLVDRLLASERWKDQLALAGRVRPEEDDVRAVTQALVASQGSLTTLALARKLALPVSRLESKLNALRKVLNVEGYPVLDHDEVAQTVRLDEALMREQFALEP